MKEENIMFVSLIMARVGVHTISSVFPKVKVVTVAVDPEMTDNFYIVPGIGEVCFCAFFLLEFSLLK